MVTYSVWGDFDYRCKDNSGYWTLVFTESTAYEGIPIIGAKTTPPIGYWILWNRVSSSSNWMWNAQIGKLLMHTGCKSDLGLSLQVSLEAFIIELGMSCQPFMEDYTATNKWVTYSWLKTIWEKAHRLQIKIELGKPVIRPPRGENDYWVMKEL